MSKKLDDVIQEFRYKRSRLTVKAWTGALFVLISGVVLLNLAISNIAAISNPWVITLGVLAILILSISVYTISYELQMRKALDGFSYLLEDECDPVAYLAVIDSLIKTGRKGKTTPALLQAQLRGYMYSRNNADIVTFITDNQDFLGESANVRIALFRAKSFDEKRADVDAFENAMLSHIERQEKRSKKSYQLKNIQQSRLWVDVECKLARRNYQGILDLFDTMNTEELTNLEKVRVAYYQAISYERLGNNKEALKAYAYVGKHGKTTNFAREAANNVTEGVS